MALPRPGKASPEGPGYGEAFDTGEKKSGIGSFPQAPRGAGSSFQPPRAPAGPVGGYSGGQPSQQQQGGSIYGGGGSNGAAQAPTIGTFPSPGMGYGGGGGQQQPSQQPQRQQVPQAPAGGWNEWSPAAMQDPVNKQMMDMGSSMAQSYISNTMAAYQPGVAGMWAHLKYYFAVNNSYVLRKLKILLLPYLRKSWARQQAATDDGQTKFAQACVDDNAPDLYLPLMSFITYILITGFVKGKSGSFTPVVLSEVMSACMVTQLLELLLMKLGLYLLGAQTALLDVLAFTSYKYVGLCVNMTLGVLTGARGYYVSFFWTSFAMAYFMFKTMAHSIPVGAASREIFVLGFALLQLLVIWWLGYTGDLQ